MGYNWNFGWGRLIANALRTDPRTGKVLIVCASTHVNYEELNEIFPAQDKIRVVTTLQAAIDLATSNEDDVIFLTNGHSETITAAAQIIVNKTGVKIIGLGVGSNRPTINFTTVIGADLEIDNNFTVFENIIFDLTGFDALTAPIDVDATYCTFKNCEFITADVDGQCILGILTDANASGLTVENCYFRGTQTAGTTAAIRIVGGSNHVIRNNVFIGAYGAGVGAIQSLTTDCDNTLVKDNFIWNTTAASTKALVFTAESTAFIVGNKMQIKSGVAPITGAFASWAGSNEFARVTASNIFIGAIKGGITA